MFLSRGTRVPSAIATLLSSVRLQNGLRRSRFFIQRRFTGHSRLDYRLLRRHIRIRIRVRRPQELQRPRPRTDSSQAPSVHKPASA